MSEHQNDFTWWLNALAGNRAPINVNAPEAGFYKARGGEPVAYWWDTKTGELRCHLDGRDVNEQRALELWPFVSKAPVAREDYDARRANGMWPGDHPAVIGHNAAPPEDTPEAIAERIADLAREAETMITAGAATTDAICDQASDLGNTFGELEAKVTALHKVEKEPHLEAGRAVDRRWFSLRDQAADLKRRLKLVVVTPFLRKKDEDAAKAKVAAIVAGAEPESLPQQRLTAGSSKRFTALRTQVSAEVTDWAALLAALKDNPAIREAAQRIANASAKAGVELPGTKIVKTKVAA